MMIWISISIRYVELIASDGITITILCKLITCLFPGMVGIILPICVLIALIASIHKMRTDNEMTVLITSGKNEASVFAPVMIFSLLAAASEFYVQTVISPEAYKRFDIIQEKLKNQLSMSIVKTRTFNVIGSSIVYIGNKKQSSLEDIFISYIPKDDISNVNIITARRGSMYADKDGNYFIVLDNGCRQELKKDNTLVSSLKFKNFSYDITQFLRRYHYSTGKPNTKTQKELLRYAEAITDQELKRNCVAEYHYRFLSPFVIIINALIVGLLLLKAVGRGERRLDIMKCFAFGALNQVCFLIAKNITTRCGELILANYIAVALVTAILGVHFIRRSVR
jgi:lipopolysaccharide export system permease protein